MTDANRPTAIIVQARMSSRRLPGKVLMELQGRPLLQWMLERLRGLGPIIVATSEDASDDPIGRFCLDADVPCFRGPLDDVAGRFASVVEGYGLWSFVRLCADSPLIDPSLVERAMGLFAQGEWDLVSNTQPRTFPRGQSVEVVRARAFLETLPLMDDAEDREHVTRYFYRHASRFRIGRFACPSDCSQVRLVVDTSQDLADLAALVGEMDGPHWHYRLEEILQLMDRPAVAAV